mmetsp:Transcript_15845/g.45765  ORF Transcript_15845/g.45765 Transcript_15845/m.45765 type:complete len:833 (-) Transcript_15845:206-2704(-)
MLAQGSPRDPCLRAALRVTVSIAAASMPQAALSCLRSFVPRGVSAASSFHRRCRGTSSRRWSAWCPAPWRISLRSSRASTSRSGVRPHMRRSPAAWIGATKRYWAPEACCFMRLTLRCACALVLEGTGPTAEASSRTKKKDIGVWVNEQEHLRVIVRRAGDSLQACFEDLVKLFGCMERAFATECTSSRNRMFATSERLGFLTSNPTNLGTGLQAVVVVKLPLLAARSAQGLSGHWQSWCGQQHVQARLANMQSEYQAPDMFELTNLYRFGVSEVDLLNLLMRVTSCLIQMEMRLEAGHPIDDLLSKSLVGEVPDDAIGNSSQAAAAVLFNGILSSVVAELKPLPDAGEADEICAPTDAPKEASGRLWAGACSPPGTGASVWTLNAGSESSITAGQAEDVIAKLIDTEVSNQASLPDIDHVRFKALEVLTAASEDGTLEKVVNEMRAECCPRNQMHSGLQEADLALLRQRARVAMLSSLQDGSLQGAVNAVREELMTQGEDERIAATKLQAAQRGRQTRHAVAKMKAEEDAAATKLQAAQRGRQTRQAVAKMKDASAPPCSDDLRAKAAAAMEQAFNSGAFDVALAELSAIEAEKGAQPGSEKAPAAVDLAALREKACQALLAAASNGTLEQLVRSLHKAKAQAPPVLPVPPSKPKVGAAPPRPGVLARCKKDVVAGRSTAALLLDAVSERDRRIGELVALVRETQVRIVQREEQCRHVEGLLTTARSDLGHIELDIEWHRRALEGAEGRRSELEAGHRKLRSELDQKYLDFKHLDVDACAAGLPGLLHSARSEVSAATASTMATAASTAPAFMQTPRHPPGAVLQPLQPKR